MPEEELKACYEKSASYENRAGYQKEHLKTEKIGEIIDGDKIKEIYKDTEENYWYKNKYIKDGKIISEYEKIFGYPEPRKKRWRI